MRSRPVRHRLPGSDPLELRFADRRQSGGGRHPDRARVPHRKGRHPMTRTLKGPPLTLPVGDRDHAQGPADAPATLVEYGDYECPHCGRAFPIIQSVQRHFGARLRFVFRNFPITESHPHAALAAEAAEIAADHGKFWEMHDLIYDHQDRLEPSDLAAYASQLGIPAD